MNDLSSSAVIVRKFMGTDRSAVRRISQETAFLQASWQNFIDDGELLADALTFYYTDYEPESCFVAVVEDKVVGYITGSVNVRGMHKVFFRKIFPKLFLRTLSQRLFLRKNSARFFLHLCLSFLKGEFAAPDFSKDYPATLHINIDKNYRGLKIGSRLIEAYLDFLRERHVRGVHFGSMSEGAKTFFTKLGFRVLLEGRRSYLKYYFRQEFAYWIFGKAL